MRLRNLARNPAQRFEQYGAASQVVNSEGWYNLRVRPTSLRGFDSSTVTVGERLHAWEDVTSRLLVPLEMWSRTETIDGHIREISHGVVSVSRFTASPHFGIRSQAAIDRATTRDLIKVATVLRGTVTVAQGEHRTTLRPGETAVYTTRATYSVGSDVPFDLAIALVPLGLTGAPHAAVLDAAARPLDPVSARALREAILSPDALVGAGEEIFSDRIRLALSRIIEPSTTRRDADQLYREALEVIHHRLRSHRLSPDYIAEVLGISRRSLYLAFSTSGVAGVAQTIRSLRLNYARDRIVRFPEIPIRELAAEVGFHDPAHFTRAYRSEFGEVPSLRRENGQSVQNDVEGVTQAR